MKITRWRLNRNRMWSLITNPLHLATGEWSWMYLMGIVSLRLSRNILLLLLPKVPRVVPFPAPPALQSSKTGKYITKARKSKKYKRPKDLLWLEHSPSPVMTASQNHWSSVAHKFPGGECSHNNPPEWLVWLVYPITGWNRCWVPVCLKMLNIIPNCMFLNGTFIYENVFSASKPTKSLQAMEAILILTSQPMMSQHMPASNESIHINGERPLECAHISP